MQVSDAEEKSRGSAPVVAVLALDVFASMTHTCSRNSGTQALAILDNIFG